MRRGPMDQVGAYKLDRNRDKFEEYLEPNDIMGKLIALDVLSENDIDTIKHTQPPTRQTRVSAFMKIIKARGSNAYPMFLEALKAAEYQYLIDMLEKTPVQGIQEEVHVMRPKGAVSEVCGEDEFAAVRNKNAVPKTLIKISRAVGIGWEMVALGLGVTPVQIEQAKLQYQIQGPPMQFYGCLEKWKSSSRDAKYGPLIDVLHETSGTVTIDWKRIREAFNEVGNS